MDWAVKKKKLAQNRFSINSETKPVIHINDTPMVQPALVQPAQKPRLRVTRAS